MEENKDQDNVTSITPPPASSAPSEQPAPPKPKFINPIIIAGLVFFLILLGSASAYFLILNKSLGVRACTLEAKICPDGSSVGRTGTLCEFKACPDGSAPQATDITAWKETYTNSKYDYSFTYPENVRVLSGIQDQPGNEEMRRMETTANIQVIDKNPRTAYEPYLQIITTPENRSLEQVKTTLLANNAIKNMEVVKVDSINALRYEYNSSIIVEIIRNNIRYSLTFDDSPVPNGILSTFRFG